MVPLENKLNCNEFKKKKLKRIFSTPFTHLPAFTFTISQFKWICAISETKFNISTVASTTLYPIWYLFYQLSQHPLWNGEKTNKNTSAFENKAEGVETNEWKKNDLVWIHSKKKQEPVPMYVQPIVQFHKGHLTSF